MREARYPEDECLGIAYLKESHVEYPHHLRKPETLAFLLLTLVALPFSLTGCKDNKATAKSASAATFNSSSTATKGAQTAPLAPVTPAEPTSAAAPAASAASAAVPAVPGASTPVFAHPSSASHAPKAVKAAKGAKTKGTPAAALAAPAVKYRAGEDPDFAARKGWPVKVPAALPGSLLPQKRIVAYYGNPLSKKMGALGEYQKDDMLLRLKRESARWQAADPAHPVQPALHLIAVVAQGEPGKAGMYRMIMPDAVINKVYDWAKEAHAILFIDIQTGHDNIRTVLPRFEWLLKNPDVHLGIDPEFNLIKSGAKPGSKIGTYDAADINYASGYLKDLVKKYNLPPKVFIVHRFTRNGVTNYRNIVLRPEVQVVMNMDGWGAPWLKRDSYKDYVVSEPVELTGFKLFYHNDTKKGDALLTPAEVLKLYPKPLYIQYQ
jgi:hypothetical protein